MNHILDTISIKHSLDKLPNPIYCTYMYHLLKSWGEDVSIVTPKWCFSEFIYSFPQCAERFLQLVENSDNIQENLKQELIKSGMIELVGEDRLNEAFQKHSNQL